MPIKPALVLLHGWGMNPRVWNPVLGDLQAEFDVYNLSLPTVNDLGARDQKLGPLVEHILDQAPGDALWLGWSLGATVALQAALSAPGRIRRLILVAATPKFINSEDWLFGVDRDVMDKFCLDLAADYNRTLTRFLLLQTAGLSRSFSRSLAMQISNRGAPDISTLNMGLKILGEADLRSELKGLDIPCHLIHGASDKIVPKAAADYMVGQLPSARLELMQAGHAPFLCHREAFLAAVHAANIT